MSEQEQKFEADNEMTVSEAFSFVKQWMREGEKEKAQKGAEEILKYLPDHHGAKNIINEIEGRDPEPSLFDVLTHNIKEKSEEIQVKVHEKMHKQEEEQEKMDEENIEKAKKEGKEIKQESLPSVGDIRDDEKLASIFCYAWFLVIIPLILKKDSKFVQFHAWQGASLTIISLLISYILLSPLQLFSIAFVFFMRAFVFIIYLSSAYLAYKGKWFKLPGVYPFSEKLRKIF